MLLHPTDGQIMKSTSRSGQETRDPLRFVHRSEGVRLAKIRSARKALQTRCYESDEVLDETALRVCADIVPARRRP